MPIFGCIADDFTGASDAASFLVKGGMSVQLFNGIPKEESLVVEEIQCIVIALKSRTQDTKDAVVDTIKVVKWLQKKGVEQFYLKYCSTFDSTPKGNIGPIADCVMEFLHVPFTILCPALPANGRIIRHGDLYVDGVPLQESPMRYHPLTPMNDCNIARLMKPQSQYPCVELWNEVLHKPFCEVQDILKKYKQIYSHFYVIPDYNNSEDGKRIAELFGELRLLTGGSGILEWLGYQRGGLETCQKKLEIRAKGSAILLAGSCSKATLEQIQYFQEQGGISYKINPLEIVKKENNIQNIWDFVEKHQGKPVLIYSSDTAQNVKENQQYGQHEIAHMLEQTAAELAARAVQSGIQRIIVAGGETSGAVTKRLGYDSYQIGESVAPGVPVMIPVESPDIRLVLKSGNFGQKDFFVRVLSMTEMEEKHEF